jgi:hypothetical protein
LMRAPRDRRYGIRALMSKIWLDLICIRARREIISKKVKRLTVFSLCCPTDTITQA